MGRPSRGDDLVEGMLGVLEDSRERGMGRAGRERVQARFTTDAMVRDATEAIIQLISSAGGPNGA